MSCFPPLPFLSARTVFSFFRFPLVMTWPRVNNFSPPPVPGAFVSSWLVFFFFVPLSCFQDSNALGPLPTPPGVLVFLSQVNREPAVCVCLQLAVFFSFSANIKIPFFFSPARFGIDRIVSAFFLPVFFHVLGTTLLFPFLARAGQGTCAGAPFCLLLYCFGFSPQRWFSVPPLYHLGVILGVEISRYIRTIFSFGCLEICFCFGSFSKLKSLLGFTRFFFAGALT